MVGRVRAPAVEDTPSAAVHTGSLVAVPDGIPEPVVDTALEIKNSNTNLIKINQIRTIVWCWVVRSLRWWIRHFQLFYLKKINLLFLSFVWQSRNRIIFNCEHQCFLT